MSHAASKIQLFLTPFFNFWQCYAVKMPLINFGWLNLPIEEKNLQKIHIRLPCSCSAKIEAGYSTEFWRSREPWICNFCQIFLHRFTKCITLKSIFVNNLNLAIVWIPLVYNNATSTYLLRSDVTYRGEEKVSFCIMSPLWARLRNTSFGHKWRVKYIISKVIMLL